MTALDDAWVIVRGQPVFYRHAEPRPDAPVILHVHGFAISGAYMTPAAALLSDDFRTYVPDLPGFGKSLDPDHSLTIDELADSAAAFLDEMQVERATILGNSLGCAVLASFAHRYPDRIDRAILVSPAGGRNSQPLLRAIGQLAVDATREPPSMAKVAMPDYLRFGVVEALRLFVAMTRFPAFERVLELEVPTLAVLGSRDPLLPRWSQIREVASSMSTDVTVALIKDAAHAINFSHPVELASVVRPFMADEPVVASQAPGTAPIAVIR
jgi:pimeloyl-ACP methyl ester carboxylesterase